MAKRKQVGFFVTGEELPLFSGVAQTATVEPFVQREAAHQLTMLQLDARSISDGTLAKLTGLARYDQVEPIQQAFVAFCDEHPQDFETWTAAWFQFWAGYQAAEETADSRRGWADAEAACWWGVGGKRSDGR